MKNLVFTNDGTLPIGDYGLTIMGIKKSILVQGDGSSHSWDHDWRLKLVDNLALMARQLWMVGV